MRSHNKLCADHLKSSASRGSNNPMQAEAYRAFAGARDNSHQMSNQWLTLSKEICVADHIDK
jgi:hypothetical protein